MIPSGVTEVAHRLACLAYGSRRDETEVALDEDGVLHVVITKTTPGYISTFEVRATFDRATEKP